MNLINKIYNNIETTDQILLQLRQKQLRIEITVYWIISRENYEL
jgi:hypothetical protein